MAEPSRDSEKVLMTVQTLPVLPLRDIVVFPQMIEPLFVGREKSVAALEAVMENDKNVLLVSQKDAGVEDPEQRQHLIDPLPELGFVVDP